MSRDTVPPHPSPLVAQNCTFTPVVGFVLELRYNLIEAVLLKSTRLPQKHHHSHQARPDACTGSKKESHFFFFFRVCVCFRGCYGTFFVAFPKAERERA